VQPSVDVGIPQIGALLAQPSQVGQADAELGGQAFVGDLRRPVGPGGGGDAVAGELLTVPSMTRLPSWAWIAVAGATTSSRRARARLCRSAEGVGFEPTRTRQRPSGFQDLRQKRRDLRHQHARSSAGHVFARTSPGSAMTGPGWWREPSVQSCAVFARSGAGLSEPPPWSGQAAAGEPGAIESPRADMYVHTPGG
jgi:hypothetical protein